MGNVLDRDAQIMREAKEAREHEQQLAKIDASRAVEVAKIEATRREERRTWLGYFWVGTAVVLVILVIIAAIVWNVRGDKAMRESERARQAEIAKTCIEQGNIWIDNSCIIARKAGQ